MFELFPWAYATAKTIGALYLLYLAFITWRSAKRRIDYSVKPGVNAFRDGILINLANPKSVFFAAAVLVVIFPANLSLIENAIVVINQFVVEVMFYSLLAVIMSAESVSNAYLKAKKYMDRFTAIVLGSLGLRLLLQK